MAGLNFSVSWDYSPGSCYLRVVLRASLDTFFSFLFFFFLNCKLYSPAVTTPLQKTANWEGSAYILCSRGRGVGGVGGGGNERQRKESARLQHPQHPRLDCHVAATPPPLL